MLLKKKAYLCTHPQPFWGTLEFSLLTFLKQNECNGKPKVR